LKIIADFQAGKQVVIRSVEADIRCYKEILTEMNTVLNSTRFLFKEDG
jgi:hypothetical protein